MLAAIQMRFHMTTSLCYREMKHLHGRIQKRKKVNILPHYYDSSSIAVADLLRPISSLLLKLFVKL